MKDLKKVFKNWMTSLLGIIIMSFTTWKAYDNFDKLDIAQFGIIALMMTLGLILLYTRDDILFNLFNRRTK